MIRPKTLPNIGKELAKKLSTVGIEDSEDFLNSSSEEIFIRLKTAFPDTCINTLYALEGAFQGVRWHGISKERKDELNLFYKSSNF